MKIFAANGTRCWIDAGESRPAATEVDAQRGLDLDQGRRQVPPSGNPLAPRTVAATRPAYRGAEANGTVVQPGDGGKYA